MDDIRAYGISAGQARQAPRHQKRAPTPFRRTIAYRLPASSSRSTSHTGTTTIAPVSRMRPTWLMSLKPSSTICLAADCLGKQRRRVEAKSLENDPDDKRDDNQSQRDHCRRSAEEPDDGVGHGRRYRSADRP